MDQFAGEVIVNLDSQASYRDFDDVGVAVEIHVPDLGRDQRFGQHFALAAQKHFQQGEFLGGEVDAPTAAFDATADQVQAQVGQLQAGFLLCRTASTQQAAHPCQQLGKSKGLDQVIIGAQLQAVYAILYRIPRGEKQHRCIQPGATDGLQDLPAIAAGQHHVEDQQGVFTAQGQLLAGDAIGHQIGVEPGFAQALAQVLAGFGLVFDDQQFHGQLRAWFERGRYTAAAGVVAQLLTEL